MTIGRPCCSYPRCRTPLESAKHHYCAEHRSEDEICCIKDCTEQREVGFRTCSDPEHREVEKAYIESGTAFFQLRDRLKRAQMAHTDDSLANSTTAEVLEIDGGEEEEFMVRGPQDADEFDEQIDATSEVQEHLSTTVLTKRVKAQFSRSRTHNEQFIIAPCGMILARETMYFAEAISNVAV